MQWVKQKIQKVNAGSGVEWMWGLPSARAYQANVADLIKSAG
jgi:hypothetical protein